MVSGSIPDDTPSLRGSLLSSPGRKSISDFKKDHLSCSFRSFCSHLKGVSRLGHQPQDHPLLVEGTPHFLTSHSRQVSISSQISQISSQQGSVGTETPQAPWDVIRWTKLHKITGHAFSDAGKRNFGRPTCLAVSALIAVGTSKGLILGFDYHQTLKVIIGQGTKATECGSITALAIAADYSTIAAGHANGHIFTWEINRPSQPFLRIPPLDISSLKRQEHADGPCVQQCHPAHRLSWDQTHCACIRRFRWYGIFPPSYPRLRTSDTHYQINKTARKIPTCRSASRAESET